MMLIDVVLLAPGGDVPAGFVLLALGAGTWASIVVLALGVAAMAGILWLNASRKKRKGSALPAGIRDLLDAHVGFYRALEPAERERFVGRTEAFAREVRIHAVKVGLEDLDKVLVAASAVIPVFGFKEWAYTNLSDVLLYEEAFDAQHFAGPDNRYNVLGMVGSGAMERVMILSCPALREGYARVATPFNTGVHEFVHLVDKSDGAVDGIPESLLGASVDAWSQLLHTYLHAVRSGHTDINTYAGTNGAEFLAVVSEYFFKRPDLMVERHPDLYAMLSHIFQQRPRLDPQVHAVAHEAPHGTPGGAPPQ
jgi:Mlc titration factor MtfA (ptsG expression regulator)